MFEGRQVLVVVPARGGSTGVRLKNLRQVGGVPLVARAGHVASALDFVDRAIVSTDHPDIARVAKESGLDAPFVRPDALAGPMVSDWQVLVHALTEIERLDEVTYDIVVMLQPTSPNRTPSQVRATVAFLVEGGFDAVWTLSETDSKAHPLKQFVIDRFGRIDYYDPAGAEIVARQQLRPVYHKNGIAYAFTRSCLVEQGTIRGTKTAGMVIDGPVANIDTEFDLELAELLLRRNEKDEIRRVN